MLCCGRRCGCLTGPLRGYQSALAAGQWLPDLKITNNMNREAILQARRAAPATPPAPSRTRACAVSACAPPRSMRGDTCRGPLRAPAAAHLGACAPLRSPSCTQRPPLGRGGARGGGAAACGAAATSPPG